MRDTPSRRVRPPAELIIALSELASLKTVAGLLFDTSVDLPEPAAAKIGYLAQRLGAHLDLTIEALQNSRLLT